MNRQSLPPSPLFQSDPQNWMRNQSKVSGPELNHDYISYSDIKIQYRWNRGNGPLISLDHVRIRRPVESSCSWMLHKKKIAIPFPHRERFIPSHKSNLSFFYGNAMQEVGNQVVSDDEKSFYFMWNLWKPEIGKSAMLEDDCRDGQIPTVGISLKAQTERINGLLEGYLRHFSANQKDWSCWILLSTTTII